MVSATCLQSSGVGHCPLALVNSRAHLDRLTRQFDIGIRLAQHPLPPPDDVEAALSVGYHDFAGLLVPPCVTPFGSVDHEVEP